jgi:hypothetical protein
VGSAGSAAGEGGERAPDGGESSGAPPDGAGRGATVVTGGAKRRLRGVSVRNLSRLSSPLGWRRVVIGNLFPAFGDIV